MKWLRNLTNVGYTELIKCLFFINSLNVIVNFGDVKISSLYT